MFALFLDEDAVERRVDQRPLSRCDLVEVSAQTVRKLMIHQVLKGVIVCLPHHVVQWRRPIPDFALEVEQFESVSLLDLGVILGQAGVQLCSLSYVVVVDVLQGLYLLLLDRYMQRGLAVFVDKIQGDIGLNEQVSKLGRILGVVREVGEQDVKQV